MGGRVSLRCEQGSSNYTLENRAAWRNMARSSSRGVGLGVLHSQAEWRGKREEGLF